MLKTGILQFSNSENVIDLNEENNPKIEKLLELFSRDINNTLEVDVIEISKINSPSSITLEISDYGKYPTKIFFQKFRTLFTFQNGFFILDSKEINELKYDLGTSIFKIKIHCEEEFEMKMYYSIEVTDSRRKF